MYSKDCQTFYDLILADLESGRTYTYAEYVSQVNKGRDPFSGDAWLTFEDAVTELGGLLDCSGREFSLAKLLVEEPTEDPGAANASAEVLPAPEPTKQETTPEEPKEPARKAPRTAPPRRGATPKTLVADKKQTPWREPTSQAEHMKAIRESRTLKKYPRLVAFEAHVQMGITSVEKKAPFGKVKRELTSEYLAMFTGLSSRKVDDAMAEACRLGFFRRIDNGKGGRGNTNRATYTPTVPAWV